MSMQKIKQKKVVTATWSFRFSRQKISWNFQMLEAHCTAPSFWKFEIKERGDQIWSHGHDPMDLRWGRHNTRVLLPLEGGYESVYDDGSRCIYCESEGACGLFNLRIFIFFMFPYLEFRFTNLFSFEIAYMLLLVLIFTFIYGLHNMFSLAQQGVNYFIWFFPFQIYLPIVVGVYIYNTYL